MVNIIYDPSQSLVWTDSAGNTGVYSPGDIAWVLASTALVWIMIPGIGFFYSGFLRRKNALSMMYLSMMTTAVVSLQWFFWGFSLVYSDGASPFIGDLKYFALRGVLEVPTIGRARIPSIVFCVYQLMFAAFTPMIAIGGVAERARLGPLLVFVFLWSTLVYDPIACWLWNSKGWSSHSYDFAGGTPVHISSGTTAFVLSIYLGKRRTFNTPTFSAPTFDYPPHSISHIILGTTLLWFGWFGFNGGSAFAANLRAAQACIVTNLSASAAGLTWMLWEYRDGKKWSAVGFCSGAISGLIAITPASGFVGSPAAILCGALAGTICHFATQLKIRFDFDDALDVVATHAIGGLLGNLFTAIFAEARVANYDGFTVIKGGWLDRHFIQLIWHIADSCAGFGYSAAMTAIILCAMHWFPGKFLRLRVSEKGERAGIDGSQMGEFAYDYVFLKPELESQDYREESDAIPLQNIAPVN